MDGKTNVAWIFWQETHSSIYYTFKAFHWLSATHNVIFCRWVLGISSACWVWNCIPIIKNQAAKLTDFCKTDWKSPPYGDLHRTEFTLVLEDVCHVNLSPCLPIEPTPFFYGSRPHRRVGGDTCSRRTLPMQSNSRVLNSMWWKLEIYDLCCIFIGECGLKVINTVTADGQWRRPLIKMSAMIKVKIFPTSVSE